ncbi:unnamed protein product [Oikopleura dioica]|uniref:Uncharacterized protein n=1 Tax=Oikopleura dioica TaxID=34765 RepID=E4Y909_OIKDI|nr:unnamed protein product [Oikopleura dioica]
MGACVSCRTKETEIGGKRHSTAEEQEIIKAQIEETLGSVIDLTKAGSTSGKGLSGDIYSARSASTSGIGSERSSRGFSDQYEVEEDDYEDYDQLPAQKNRPQSSHTPRASVNNDEEEDEDYDVPVTSPNARICADGQPASEFIENEDEDYDVPRPFGSTNQILEEEEEDEYDIPRPHRLIAEEEEEDDIYDIPRPLLIN